MKSSFCCACAGADARAMAAAAAPRIIRANMMSPDVERGRVETILSARSKQRPHAANVDAREPLRSSKLTVWLHLFQYSRTPGPIEAPPAMPLHPTDLPADVLALLRRGTVIPAHPLALDASRNFDPVRQRALTRYYIDAGSGGLAVGVHSAQFAIREVGLYEPVLELAARTAREHARRPLVMIAGL